ncbi:PAS domain S-box-containing protein/diguanylate cyclase (GGDEF) domain-containing protein [Lentibacillus persicus]|uniref:PAS domain S-box-containing protein/diguanylate cyclase (GGDEF) domain-containing protein n=1 Tax=Lentibacillus persicus TaxID=640948 RepID=A0A1I1XDT3_9BACI|nr:diguanylate cyclase [Lentibacillus persicus]SFE04818.1 PAS domain S-box-containing protein/diguanylate cyclase (GGDEF) domain-containing protein [Lentibacillus persicus]
MKSAESLLLNNVLANGIREMVFVIKVDELENFRYEFLNKAAKERTALTDDVIGRTFHEVYPKKTTAHLTEKYKKVLDTRDIVTYEDHYESPAGIKYSETTLTPLYESGLCTHIVALVKDITARKLNEFRVEKTTNELKRNKQKYRSLYDYNLDAILSLDLNGNIVSGNNAVHSVFGYKAEDLKRKRFTDLVQEDDLNVINAIFESIKSGKAEQRQMRVCHKPSGFKEVIMKFTPIVIEETITGIFGIFKDINEQVILGKKYQESEGHFRIIADHSNDLITMINENGNIDYVSPSYKDILDNDPDEYIGRHFLHNVHLDDTENLMDSFIQSVVSHTTWKEQFRQKNGSGSYSWFELRGTPVYNDWNQFTHMVVLTRNITLRKDYEKKLQHMAFHDSLTGLPNRRYFMEQLRIQLEEKKGTKQRIAIIMMDLDQFKTINDQMGHDVGDQVIQEFGSRISSVIRQNDLLARLGGDEFILMLPDVSKLEDVTNVAERILSKLNDMWCVTDAGFNITASLGIAVSSANSAEGSDLLLRYADKQLYKAKQSGKNNYQMYDFMRAESAQ